MRIAFLRGGVQLGRMQIWKIIVFFIAIFCVSVTSRLIWKIRVSNTVQYVNQSLKQSVNHDDQSFDQTVSQTFRKHLRRWKLIHCKHCTIEPLEEYLRTSFSSCIFHQNNSQFFNEIVTHQDVDNQNEKINFKSYARALIRKTKALN